jgi:hypothetical protein
MVDIPEDEQQRKKDRASASGMRPTAKQPQRPPSDQAQKPDQRRPQQRKPSGPTGPNRRTQILSLEPPGRAPRVLRDARIDAMAGPGHATRKQPMPRATGRETTCPVVKDPQKRTSKPQLRRGEEGKPVDMGGGSNKDMIEALVKRRTTRRIPKSDGHGLTGDGPPLGGEEHRSISAPSLPPVVKLPVPKPTLKQGKKSPATPPGGRGLSLAGVSAEELLGDEGRELLEKMRRRENESNNKQSSANPVIKGPPLAPKMHDSSLVAFQSAEYNEKEAIAEDEADTGLSPESSPGGYPRSPSQLDYGMPPNDDLGYEQSVSYGSEHGTGHVASDRIMAVHEEMEQRVGYMLWLQGAITKEEVEEALAGADGYSESARELLEGSSFADQSALYGFLAQRESLALADMEKLRPSERALAVLPPAMARSFRVIPLERIGEILLLAATWPFDPKRMLELRRLTSSKIKLFIVTDAEMDAALAQYYPPAGPPTQRSPAVPSDSNLASAVTDDGNDLEQDYDPTLGGGESGLYGASSQRELEPADSVIDSFDANAVTIRHDAVENEGADDSGLRRLDAGEEEHDPFSS